MLASILPLKELGEVLKGVLAQVNATYEIAGDVVVVLPKKAVAANADIPNPPENIDPKVKEILTKKVDAPAIEKYTVKEVVEEVYQLRFPEIKFDIDDKAFKAVGIDYRLAHRRNGPDQCSHPGGLR